MCSHRRTNGTDCKGSMSSHLSVAPYPPARKTATNRVFVPFASYEMNGQPRGLYVINNRLGQSVDTLWSVRYRCRLDRPTTPTCRPVATTYKYRARSTQANSSCDACSSRSDDCEKNRLDSHARTHAHTHTHVRAHLTHIALACCKAVYAFIRARLTLV